MISTRHGPDGRDLPYELNVTYFDAVTEPGSRDTDLQVRRYLGTQALMLALRGIPAVYFSSLFGAGNDVAGVAAVRASRRINRRKFSRDELNTALERPESREARVLAGYRRLLAVRRKQPAFHPDADQQVWPDVPRGWSRCCERAWMGGSAILALVNVSGQEQSWEFPADIAFHPARELISGRTWPQATRRPARPVRDGMVGIYNLKGDRPMADFFQHGLIATIHDLGTIQRERLERMLERFAVNCRVGLVLPVTAGDMRADPFAQDHGGTGLRPLRPADRCRPRGGAHGGRLPRSGRQSSRAGGPRPRAVDGRPTRAGLVPAVERRRLDGDDAGQGPIGMDRVRIPAGGPAAGGVCPARL